MLPNKQKLKFQKTASMKMELSYNYNRTNLVKQETEVTGVFDYLALMESHICLRS